MLAQIVINKYRYHLPEYRQVRQYADLGLKLPTSTLNGWGLPRPPDRNLFTRLCATTSVTAIIYR